MDVPSCFTITPALIDLLLLFGIGGIANMLPVVCRRLPWGSAPIDGGLHLRSRRLLGKNKTRRGLIVAVVGGTIAYLLIDMWRIDLPWDRRYGMLISFGAMVGDMLGSFLKRQSDIASGESLLVRDQIDRVVGGLIVLLPLQNILACDAAKLLVIYSIAHLSVSAIGKWSGIKKDFL